MYNFTLSLASGALFFVLVRELWFQGSIRGLMDLFCDPARRNPRGLLAYCFYLNYLFKSAFRLCSCSLSMRSHCGHLLTLFPLSSLSLSSHGDRYVELADTLFLVLRGKSTPFIHVYHHAITLLLCWTQLTVQTCMQWVLISINLFVHIFLYSYYAVSRQAQPSPSAIAAAALISLLSLASRFALFV